MAPRGHPGPATTDQGASARPAVTCTRRAALFASELQRSDAPTAAMAAQAITATVRRLGIEGCLSRMAQEFGDHPDTAAERMRWISQLTTQMPFWPPTPTSAGYPISRAETEIQASIDHYRAPAKDAA